MTNPNLFPLNLIWLTEPVSRSGISEPIYQIFPDLILRIAQSEPIYYIFVYLISRFPVSELISLNLFKLNLLVLAQLCNMVMRIIEDPFSIKIYTVTRGN